MWSTARTSVWYLAVLVGAIGLMKVLSPRETQDTKGLGEESSGFQSQRLVGSKVRLNEVLGEKKKIFNPGGRSYFLSVFHEAESSPGLTLVPTSGTAEVALLDVRGRVIHKWDVDAARARLLPNGHLLVIHGSTWGESTKRWGPLMSRITEYDWEGNMVWSYEAGSKAHHDLRRLENGNTLFLREIFLPEDLQSRILDPRRKKIRTFTDEIVEVTPSGEEVYSWKFFEHFDVNYCGLRKCADGETERLKIKTLKDWSHTNSLSELGPNKWYDLGDKRFHPRNLLILPRRFWIPMIVERSSGKVVWTYEKKDYRGGLGAPHEVQMIPKGRPGAGNILLLDNGPGTHSGESFILEIEPQHNEIVWVYDVGAEFFNKTRGSVQRLENGNTLISWDREGRVLEVTPQKKTVWEVRVPSELSRARRYPLGYCQRCEESIALMNG